jgi:hypothetical protein
VSESAAGPERKTYSVSYIGLIWALWEWDYKKINENKN